MIRVPTRTHGIMDLVYSATFFAAPFILKSLGNNNGGNCRSRKNSNSRKSSNGQSKSTQNTLLPAIGATILAQGLMTNHELGAVKALPMKAHLTADLGLGAFMIAAPFVFNMDERLKIPMVALGAAGIGLALMTQTEPGYEQFEGAFEQEHESFVEEIAEMV
ncbi:MAG: hypothetical protein EOP53_02090 [Sphingobacteriales bacterium]|nr:MAG: hypothetical protein EOP53_02090 [Sphingobacteriales bacterium]